jgi:hypothetical protein
VQLHSVYFLIWRAYRFIHEDPAFGVLIEETSVRQKNEIEVVREFFGIIAILFWGVV